LPRRRLAVHGLERLPVVADRESVRLVGIVSRSDLVKPSLAYFEEEHKKERFRRVTLSRDKKRFPPVHRAG
jgi:CBS-domain-containing membrane protein